MEVQAHGLAEQVKVTAETLRSPRRIGAPVAGTNDSHYLEAGHARAHEALLCIQTGTTLNDPNRWRFSTEEFYVKSAEEMARVFAEMPGGLPEHAGGRRALQPHARLRPVPPAALRRARRPHARELPRGAGARGAARAATAPSPGDAIEARLAHELAVIEKMGFAGYFLVVWDFIRYAREQGIAVGPGPRLLGGLAGRLLPRDHEHRSDALRPALRAILEPRADLDARHGHRLRRRPARRGHPLRGRQVRPRPGRPHHHVRDAGRQGGHPRRGPRARHDLRRRRSHRQAGAGLPAEHHARRRLPEVAAARRDGEEPGRREGAVGHRAGAGGLHAPRLRARLGRRDLRRAARRAHPALQGSQAARS